MAANLSQRKLRDLVMQSTVGRCAERDLFAWCRPCGREEFVALAQFPADAVIGQVVGKLRCRLCRVAPEVVILTDARMERQVRLVGPGAYG